MRKDTRTAQEKIEQNSIPEPNTGCWLWERSTNSGGYAWLRFGGRPQIGSRVSYQAFVGPIPEGLQVNHKCNTPTCVNPDHLYAGTAKDNSADMLRSGRALFQKHPERISRGSRHSRIMKEVASRGEHHSRIMKEVASRGEHHYSKRNPDKMSRGENHSRIMKEVASRGEHHYNHTLDDSQVRVIRIIYASGLVSQQCIAQRFSVRQSQVSRIVNHKQRNRVSSA